MERSKSFFVTGIGTDVGKTIVSTLLVKQLGYNYWKPIQSGDLDYSDSQKVKNWSPETIVFPERYKLSKPISPHAAAEHDNVKISLKDFEMPVSSKLVVEGAGGLLVPINKRDTILDLLAYFKLPVVLTSRYYLGNINHTLLSIEILKSHNIPIIGLITTGIENNNTKEIILNKSGIHFMGHVNLIEGQISEGWWAKQNIDFPNW